MELTGIKRNLTQKLEFLLSCFPIVCILGARQVGKTTLAKQVCPSWHYVDLEKTSDRLRLSEDPELFFMQHPNEVILDEAQSYPEIFAILRGIVDDDRSRKGRFIITGSSSPELQKLASDSLAGRMAVIELGSLKANELAQEPLSDFYQWFTLKANQLTQEALRIDSSPLPQKLITQHWLKGGFPELSLSDKLPFQLEWFKAYEAAYIERDIAKLFPRLNHRAFQRFIRTLSFLSGTILNKAQLARDIEVAESTIAEYLQIMRGTFLWESVQSFENQTAKSIIKMPKGHFTDTGLLHYLMNIQDEDTLFSHPIIGRSFEGFVVSEILKGLETLSVGRIEAYHYRTKNGAEIDLILEGVFGLIPIEIKYGVKTPRNKLTALTQFIEEHQLPFGILINQGEDLTWLTPKIIQVPVNYL